MTITETLNAMHHAAPLLRDLMTAALADDDPPATERDALIAARDMLHDDLHDDPDYHSPLTPELLDLIALFALAYPN